MTDLEDFKLSATERHSATWTRIKAHLEERLGDHRRRNDGNLSFDETTKLRGQIKEILYLLETGEPELPTPMADHDA
jgi:hypothetical protein